MGRCLDAAAVRKEYGECKARSAIENHIETDCSRYSAGMSFGSGGNG
jgi:hypothetical protein